MARLIHTQTRTRDGFELVVEQQNAFTNGESAFITVQIPDGTEEEIRDAVRAQLDEGPSLRGLTIPDTPLESGVDLKERWERWWMAKTTYEELLLRHPLPAPPLSGRLNQFGLRVDSLWEQYERALLRYLAAR